MAMIEAGGENAHPRNGPSASLRQRAGGELGAGADADLQVDLPELVGDGMRRGSSGSGDLGVREARPGHARDRKLSGAEGLGEGIVGLRRHLDRELRRAMSAVDALRSERRPGAEELGEQHDLHARSDAQATPGAHEAVLHGRFADAERKGDRLVRLSVGDSIDDPTLGTGKRVRGARLAHAMDRHPLSSVGPSLDVDSSVALQELRPGVQGARAPGTRDGGRVLENRMRLDRAHAEEVTGGPERFTELHIRGRRSPFEVPSAPK
jgi:hypothetical protein